MTNHHAIFPAQIHTNGQGLGRAHRIPFPCMAWRRSAVRSRSSSTKSISLRGRVKGCDRGCYRTANDGASYRNLCHTRYCVTVSRDSFIA